MRIPRASASKSARGDLSSYRRAADFLNVNQVDVLSVQHEYGIFEGKSDASLTVDDDSALLLYANMAGIAGHRFLGACPSFSLTTA